MVARLTFGQMARAASGVKTFIAKKAKKITKDPFDIRIKKKGWNKPLFPKSKFAPNYSTKELVTDTAITGAGYGIYQYAKNKEKKKKKKK